MSIVNVNTETLREGSTEVKKNYNINKEYYDKVDRAIANCNAFKAFRGALNRTFENYTEHSNVLSEKLTECATALEEADDSIGTIIIKMIEERNKKIAAAATSNGYVNPYDPDNLPNATLYDMQGVLKFTQNGKRVYETFCNTCLKYSTDLKF